MVLGVNVMKKFCYLTLFFLMSCSSASENTIDEISLFSHEIKVIEESEKCYLVYGNEKKLISPKPPCHFLRSPKQTPQYYSYANIGVDAVLIVSGSPVSNETRKEWGLSDDLVCGVDSQGVLIKNGEIHVPDKVLEGGVLCRDKGSDEKNFWYFSH